MVNTEDARKSLFERTMDGLSGAESDISSPGTESREIEITRETSSNYDKLTEKPNLDASEE
jgi:hypothetical protein